MNYSIKLAYWAALFILGVQPSFADHGGSQHQDFGMSVPASSSTGAYTITWDSIPIANALELEEMTPGGSFVGISGSNPDSMSFSGKAAGTYTYRMHFEYCPYECTEEFSLSQSIVVTSAPAVTPTEAALALVEDNLGQYFVEILSAIKSDPAEIQAFSDILASASADELGGASYTPNPIMIREATVIRKIRYLQNIGTAYAQGSIYSANRVPSGYTFSLDGEEEIGDMTIAGTIPSDLAALLGDYFAYRNAPAGE